MKIKICGIMRGQDTEVINQTKPEFVGLVFAPESRRKVSFEQGKKLRGLIKRPTKTVGVFTCNTFEEIANLVERGIIDVVQFHGEQTKEDVAFFKAKFPNAEVIKALSGFTISDLLDWQESKVDYLLLDNGKGGTGESFDWEILKEIPPLRTPLFIAGGLSPQNVCEVAQYQPFAVDVSSGVETNKEKDKDKIIEFIKKVRQS